MALIGGQVGFTGYQRPDYSGVAEAASLPARQMAGMVQQVGDYFKQQGEKKKLIKKSQTQIDAALKLFPDLAPALQGASDQIRDENIPLSDRVAAAESITGLINMGIGEMRNAQSNLLRKQQLEDEADYRERMATASEARATASLLGAKQAAGELKETEISIFDPEIGKERKEKVLIDKQGQYYEPDTKRPILNKEKFFYGEEGGLGELPPTSQVGDSASDLIASAANGTFNVSYKTRDQLPKSSANNRLISLDFNAAANPNARGVEVIIPNNATPQEKAAAQRYVNGTVEMFAKYGVKVPNRGVKTVAQNKRGASGVIHLEPAFGMDKESMAILQQYPEEYAKVVSDSFSGLPVTVIPPHKQGDPGASANGITEQGLAIQRLIPAFERLSQQGSAQASPTAIDNALAMGGDMTQQAMGTPQQQAEAARQIEQGQQLNLSTAQNIPQGAIPTELSMTAQQPQLPQPQRRMVRGIPADGGKVAPVMMTSEQVKNLEGQGFRVSAIPNPDGTFMVSGVTTGGSSKGIEVKTADGTIITYGGSGGLAQPKLGFGDQLVPDPTSPTGTRVIQVPGGESEKAAKQEAAASEAARKRAIELGSVAIAEIDNFINYTDRMSQLPFASPARKIFAAAGMEEQSEAESSLATVAANLKFEALDALRKASPTGASGLGQVTQTEFQSLSDQWGALRLTGDPEKIKERAIRIKKQLLDVVHGDKAHRDALLKTNVITKQQYDEIQSQYPGEKQASREDANLERWRKRFTPQPTQ